MRLGISKYIIKVNTRINLAIFKIKKRTLGFENANAYMRRLDKNSIIPILKTHGAIIGNNCDIETPLTFHNCKDFTNLVIGSNVHIGKECFFDLEGKITVEDNAVLSMRTTLITHVSMGSSILSTTYPYTKADILIKKSSYIGASSTILLGVTIDENSIIGAGSIVNKNIKANSIVAGSPAKEIKLIQ